MVVGSWVGQSESSGLIDLNDIPVFQLVLHLVVRYVYTRFISRAWCYAMYICLVLISSQVAILCQTGTIWPKTESDRSSLPRKLNSLNFKSTRTQMLPIPHHLTIYPT